jgi:hypothetical protein
MHINFKNICEITAFIANILSIACTFKILVSWILNLRKKIITQNN